MIDGRDGSIAMCQLSLPGFEGSAETFLALVAQHKLAADEVPMADVTKQFLSHMKDSDYLDLQLAGELMAASARLMMMKSSRLLIQTDDSGDDDSGIDTPFDATPRLLFQDAIESLSGREGRESFPPDCRHGGDRTPLRTAFTESAPESVERDESTGRHAGAPSQLAQFCAPGSCREWLDPSFSEQEYVGFPSPHSRQ